MATRRRARSASRKSEPSSPPQTRSSTTTPQKSRQSARTQRPHAAPSNPGQLGSRKKLQPVVEEPGDEIVVAQLDGVRDDSHGASSSDSESEASISDVSYSSQGSENFSALDRDLMIDSLVSIESDATGILSMIRDQSVEELTNTLVDPTSTLSKRFHNFERRLDSNLNHFQKRLLLQTGPNVQKLCNVSRHTDLSEIAKAKWRPDSVLLKVNLALWLKNLLHSRTDATHDDQRDMLQYLSTIDIFPSPFTDAESLLDERASNLWIDLLTQWYILLVVDYKKNKLSFDRDEVLRLTFLDEEGNSRSMRGHQVDAEAQTARRMAEIRKHFRPKPGHQINLSALQKQFPWPTFLNEAVLWINTQQEVLNQRIKASKSVQEIASRLSAPEFAPVPDKHSPKKSTRQSASVPDTNFDHLLGKQHERSERFKKAYQNTPSRDQITERDPGVRVLRDITKSYKSKDREVAQTPDPTDHDDNHQMMGVDDAAELDAQEVLAIPGSTSAPQPSQSALIPTQQTKEVLRHLKRLGNESNKENKTGKGRLLDRQPDAERVQWDSPERESPRSKRGRVERDDQDDEEDDFQVDVRSPKRKRGDLGKNKASLVSETHHERSPSFNSVDEETPVNTQPSPRQRTKIADTSREFALRGPSTGVARNRPAAPHPIVDDDLDRDDEEEEEAEPPSTARKYEDTKAQAKNNVQKLRALNPPMRARAGLTQIRRAWTSEEVEALIEGVAMHGCKWAIILEEDAQEEEPRLQGRTNVQLKDKARNIKLDFLKAERDLPLNFIHVTISKDHKRQLDELGIRYPGGRFVHQDEE